VATARWRVSQNVQGAWTLQIDRLLCGERYHRSGFAYRCLHKIVSAAAADSVELKFIEITIPESNHMQWIAGKLHSLGFIISDRTAESWCKQPARMAVLDLGDTAARRSELNRIQSYLLQKTATLIY
jgi:hypothetical protein